MTLLRLLCWDRIGSFQSIIDKDTTQVSFFNIHPDTDSMSGLPTGECTRNKVQNWNVRHLVGVAVKSMNYDFSAPVRQFLDLREANPDPHVCRCRGVEATGSSVRELTLEGLWLVGQGFNPLDEQSGWDKTVSHPLTSSCSRRWSAAEPLGYRIVSIPTNRRAVRKYHSQLMK